MLGTEYFDRVSYIAFTNAPENSDWIAGFNELGGVKTLLLSGEGFSDETLSQFTGSKTLVELSLWKCKITDDGLQHMQKFPGLRWLNLDYTSITDEGLQVSAALENLEEISVRNTNVSQAAIDTLKIRLPRVTFHR